MSNHPNHDDRALLNLVEQHAGDDFVRELLSWALHRVMEAEVGELTGAGKGEHAPRERGTLPREPGFDALTVFAGYSR